MLPDSTHEVKSAAMKRTSDSKLNPSKPKKKVPKKLKKKKVPSADEFTSSDLDLSRELHPISYYVRDRREMIRQVFLTLNPAKISGMLPEILKRYSQEQVEELCFEQVQVMSKKRILDLLNGKKSCEISSSSTEDSEQEDALPGEKVEPDAAAAQPPDSTSTEVATPDVESLYDPAVVVSTSFLDATIHQATSPDDAGQPILDKTKMEILELEMRAKAIKRMLERQRVLESSEAECAPVQGVPSQTRNQELRAQTQPTRSSDAVTHVNSVTTKQELSAPDSGGNRMTLSQSSVAEMAEVLSSEDDIQIVEIPARYKRAARRSAKDRFSIRAEHEVVFPVKTKRP